MHGPGPGQVSWSLFHLLGVLLDVAVHDVPLVRSQAAAVHKQSQDLWAGQACTAPVRDCGLAVGRNDAQPELDAGGQAGPTSPGH